MTEGGCHSDRKHTPIVSKKQRGFFGAELARAKAGRNRKTDMPIAELERHLHEAKGKNLPSQSLSRSSPHFVAEIPGQK
jgi:hypothetical protein